MIGASDVPPSWRFVDLSRGRNMAIDAPPRWLETIASKKSSDVEIVEKIISQTAEPITKPRHGSVDLRPTQPKASKELIQSNDDGDAS